MPKRRKKTNTYELSKEVSVEEEDHNAWAVSYGDMVSVLLTFFILLISFSTISPNKFENARENLKSTKKKTSVEQLNEKLEKLVEENQLEQYLNVVKTDLGVDINIQNEILFSKGLASLSAENAAIINEIIGTLKELPKEFSFEIEGHTDDIPIRNARYPSNWYLSTDRALSVLNVFIDNGFDTKKLKVQGLADTQPIKPLRDSEGNPIEENRKLNRRVLIKVR